jgi:myo-inositol-1(or 4)-monophosphatase
MDFYKEYELAKAVVKEAGEVVRSYLIKSNHKRNVKDDIYNIVTEADIICENFIKNKLGKEFPEYGFIGEESEQVIKDISWIIDPIDGTVAFDRQIPEFGIAVALKSNTEVVFSVMNRIMTDDIFHAYKGLGAYRNNKFLNVSNTTTKLQDCVLSIGHQNFWEAKYQPDSLSLIKETRSFRVSYSSLIESTYISEGKLDMLIKFEQYIWDVAPQFRLMSEAGIIVVDKHGNPLKFSFQKDEKLSYLAANKYLLNEVSQKSFFNFQ